MTEHSEPRQVASSQVSLSSAKQDRRCVARKEVKKDV
jgi:hypothetical protein